MKDKKIEQLIAISDEINEMGLKLGFLNTHTKIFLVRADSDNVTLYLTDNYEEYSINYYKLLEYREYANEIYFRIDDARFKDEEDIYGAIIDHVLNKAEEDLDEFKEKYHTTMLDKIRMKKQLGSYLQIKED